MLAGGLSYPLSAAPRLLPFYDEFVKAAPDELATACSLALTPTGEATVSIAACYCGAADEGERVLRPLRTYLAPVEDTIQPMPYLALQSAPDAGFPPGRLHYWKAGWLRSVTGDAIDTLMRFVPRLPSPFSGIGLQQLHGAAARVAPIGHRLPAPGRAVRLPRPRRSGPIRSTRRATSSGRGSCSRRCGRTWQDAVYVNNLGDEGPDRVRAAYGPNFERLAAVKARHDPENLFRANQNIAPAAAGSGARHQG